ncbi:hypothetical protein [Deinococcus radiophilus]|uniref:hypothetical protein n=1 Tax=Deinococcus radiophilus TaxID=32062 RepID=UPI003621F25D
MDFQLIAESMPYLLEGARLTLIITAVSLLAGIIIGTLVALARLSGMRRCAGWPRLTLN